MQAASTVGLVLLVPWMRQASAINVTYPNGLPSCRCVEWAGLDKYIVGEYLIVKPVGEGVSYKYPKTYGEGSCQAHDYGLPPFCDGTGGATAAWCEQPWCYVSPTCTGVSKTSTSSIGMEAAYSEANIFWSFQTCAQSNAYLKMSARSEAAANGLLDITEGYLRSSRIILESGSQINASAVNRSSVSGSCPYYDMCNCEGCKQNIIWNGKMDFEHTGVWMKNSVTGSAKNTMSCLARGAATVFEKVATKETDVAHSRPGYMYFGDQSVGGYVQWPNQQQDFMCNDAKQSYDPRFRPWYGGAVTGPKDVVIVVDVSGSMVKEERHVLARKAVKKIIDTLTWKDFATIILFNHVVFDVSSKLMLPMHAANRKKFKDWVDTGDWKSGGTDFITALDHTFDILGASVKASATTTCQKLIMFLTDGDAAVSEDEFARVKKNSKKYDTLMLTYALGSGADHTTMKRLACENNGVYYSIPDNSDLSSMMASYYEYLSAGQEMCVPSYIKFAAVGVGTELYAGCLPSYNRTATDRKILGVACMDINMLAEPEELKKQQAWKHLVCKMSDQTKTCKAFHLDECQKQKIRLAVGTYSVCGADSAAAIAKARTEKCGCFDRNCQDDTSFVDSQKYFCDVWIGDDCGEAHSRWGYTAAEEVEIMSKCKRSCGRCTWHSTCPYKTTNDCLEQAKGPTQCRACLGKVNGVDIEGNPASCGCAKGSDKDCGCKTCGCTNCWCSEAAANCQEAQDDKLKKDEKDCQEAQTDDECKKELQSKYGKACYCKFQRVYRWQNGIAERTDKECNKKSQRAHKCVDSTGISAGQAKPSAFLVLVTLFLLWRCRS